MLAYLLTLFASAGSGIYLLPLDTRVSLFGLFCLMLSGIYYYRRYYALTHSNSISSIILQKETCRLNLAGGRHLDSILADGQYVSNFLVVLHLSVKGHAVGLWLPLFADSVAPDLFRQIKVKLRYPDWC